MKHKLPLRFWWLLFCEVVWRLIAWGEMPVRTNGTPHSLEDCYEAILIDAGIDLEIEWEDGN